MNEWAQGLLEALLQALPSLIQAATDAMAQVSINHGNQVWDQMSSSMQTSGANFLTRTPPELSYNLGAVTTMYREFEPALIGALVLAFTLAGILVLGREYFGWGWQPLSWAPRALIAVAVIVRLPAIYAFVIDLFNAVCDAIVGTRIPQMPAPAGIDLVELAVMLIVWVVLGFRLLIRMGYWLVYFAVVLITGVLAVIAAVVPGWYPYHVRWRQTFFGLLLGKLLAVLCLAVAAAMTGSIGTSWAGVAISAAVLMIARDMLTMFAPIEGGGLGGLVRQSVSVVRSAGALF